jgi:hypothetical protein
MLKELEEAKYAFDADFSSIFLPALMGVYLLNRSY